MPLNACFHIVGCVLAEQPATAAFEECIDWLRRYDAEVLASNEREAVFVKFDAIDAQLVLFGCRAAAFNRPPVLQFGFASGIKEAATEPGGPARVGERGIMQACDLAGAAQPGRVLVSSQLGSLLQVAKVDPSERMRSTRVRLLDGRMASAYAIDPPRPHGAADSVATR